MTDRTLKILNWSLLGLLIVWGGFTFLAYMGVPVHQAVLIGDTQVVTDACPDGGAVCNAVRAVFPAIGHTLGALSPFTWYIVWSVVIFGVLIGLEFFRSGEFKIRLTMTPLKLILTTLGLLWLLFTVMSNGGSGDQPYRQLYRPDSRVYPGADWQTLEILSDDYDHLKERGCLTVIQTAAQGIEVSNVSQRCMQQAFVTRVFTEFVAMLFLLLVCLSLGRQLLSWLRVHTESTVTEAIFSVGIGACGLIVVLWTLAVAGLYTALAGWLIMLALPVLLWKQSLYWLKKTVHHQWHYDEVWYAGGLILAWVLISYLLLNFLTVMRPFPIGWDDLGVYMNDPRLLVSYGKFIPRMDAFQWEYVTSLGFLLFGYDTAFGATTGLVINWLAGLFAVGAIYAFASRFLGPKRGVLAALLYYTLPLVGHFSFADMKVDNAVFTMGALCMFALFAALFPSHEHEDGHHASISKPLLLLAGLFGGFAFAMKPTAIMVVMSMFAVLLGVLLQWSAFIGGGFLAWAVFTSQGVFNVSDFFSRVAGNPMLMGKHLVIVLCGIIGLAVAGVAAYLRPHNIKKTLVCCGIFLGTFALSIAPWIIHNNIVAGNVIPRLLVNAPNRITPDFLVGHGKTAGPDDNARFLPAELQVNDMSPACTGGTSKQEELDRYWGYGTGIGHYLGLPWRSVMNSDGAGYYVTTVPALLLFPLLLLLPYFWSRKAKWLRWTFVATFFLVMQWVFFANGVPWYGIGMFLGLAVGLETLVAKAPNASTKWAASIVLGLSIMIAFGNRLWQYDTQKNLYAYAFGLISADAMEERTIPHYNLIRDIALSRATLTPDTPYIYRIGTFIPYFIPKNLEILPVADNQLDLFTCINQDKNADLTLKRLKALGFNSIIFDTNTATIEKDVNGSLHKKVQAFLDFVNTPGLGLEIVVDDQAGGVVYLLLP